MLICGLILIDHLLLYDDYLRILPRSVVITAVQKLYLTRLIRCKGVSHLTTKEPMYNVNGDTQVGIEVEEIRQCSNIHDKLWEVHQGNLKEMIMSYISLSILESPIGYIIMIHTIIMLYMLWKC
jgi:hypothetical protein